MSLLILALPLFGCITGLGFGRYIGYRGTAVVTLTCISLSTLFSILTFYEVGSVGIKQVHLANWFNTTDLFNDAAWGLKFDTLTMVMLCVITFVSTLVHLYSLSYMEGDPHIPRFLSYLSVFTFFMLVLVSANNFVQMFVGWEGVGLASYLLINFWYTRVQANKSAIKALLVNRVGDVALALAIFTIYLSFSSLDYTTVFQGVQEGAHTELICVLLFIGAVGKSAQLGLHTWLPDAMEGPTPVSALIHAATMVTAGVFLVVRCSPMFQMAPFALTLVTVVGALTAVFAATIGLFQNDIKRVIAYSTCSQLGYMFFACGLEHYSIAVFHLVNHAFFKALLFLSAGSLIHSIFDEQDLRKMGGLTRSLPFTYSCMLLGKLALMGTPFLAGYYSKDSLLEVAYARYGELGHGVYLLGSIAAFLTAAYSFRLMQQGFYRQPQSQIGGKLAQAAPAHEAEARIVIPLSLLAVGSMFSGYLLKESFLGAGTDFLLGNGSIVEGRTATVLDSEFVYQGKKLQVQGWQLPNQFAAWLPLVLSAIGGFLGVILPSKLNRQTLIPAFGEGKQIGVPDFRSRFVRFLTKRWFYDKITNDLVVRSGLGFAYQISLKTLDKGFIEVFGPYGLPKLFTKIASALRGVQSGKIPHYAFIIVIGLTAAIGVGRLPGRLLFLCAFIYIFEVLGGYKQFNTAL